MIDTEKMRESFVGHDNATHYEGCEYVHFECAIEVLCREVDRLRMYHLAKDELMQVAQKMVSEEQGEVCEPDWLPAPDKIPSDLAPAQMVEIVRPRFEEPFKTTARSVVWPVLNEKGGNYRPLYSDSGEVLCSAEGLEEWARFVATDEGGKVYQYDCHVSHDAEEWCPTNSGKWFGAPESHRRPGPWIESIMEVMR